MPYICVSTDQTFIVMKRYICLGLCLLGLLTGRAQVGDLPRAVPEDEGIPSAALSAFFDSLQLLPGVEVHGVMVLRHGRVVGEVYPQPFDARYKHTVFSCSKTFVAAAVGLAVADNRLRLDDRVAVFFPEMLPDSVSPALADMTVRHLLTMTSGVKPDWQLRNHSRQWVRDFLAKPVHEPGKHFAYDSMVTYLLAAIVQKVTGKTLLDYLQERIFTPLNIHDVAWEVSPEGIQTGGWGLHIQAESMAKFGQLLLQGGCWQGRQLLPRWWVEQMSARQMETGGDAYGFQMWLCEYAGAVRADGALGQYILIIPDKDMVVVITECSLNNGRPQRRLVWNGLLPAVSDQPLQAGRDYRRLQKRTSEATLPLLPGRKSSALSRQLHGKTFYLGKNRLGWQSIRMDFDEKDCVALHVTADALPASPADTARALTYTCGYRRWLKLDTSGQPLYSIRAQDRFKGLDSTFVVAGQYAWASPQELKVQLRYVDWFSGIDLTFRVAGDRLLMTYRENYRRGEATEVEGTSSVSLKKQAP